MLDNNAQVDLQDIGGCTSLMLTSAHNPLEVAKVLVVKQTYTCEIFKAIRHVILRETVDILQLFNNPEEEGNILLDPIIKSVGQYQIKPDMFDPPSFMLATSRAGIQVCR